LQFPSVSLWRFLDRWVASNPGLRFRGSGRLDLNPPPVAPQGPSAVFHGVAPVSTEYHPVEITEVRGTGSFHTEAPNAYKDTPFGAPVARLGRVQWLTPGEVAARLQVCRATVYKLCDAGQLGYAASASPSGSRSSNSGRSSQPGGRRQSERWVARDGWLIRGLGWNGRRPTSPSLRESQSSARAVRFAQI
jgi:hypothetical protein